MTIKAEVDELDIIVQDLDSNTVKVIQERVKAKLDRNKEQVNRVLNFYQGVFKKLYGLLATLANVTRNSVHVYLKFFSVTDTNQQILARSKRSSISKPSVRGALSRQFFRILPRHLWW